MDGPSPNRRPAGPAATAPNSELIPPTAQIMPRIPGSKPKPSLI